MFKDILEALGKVKSRSLTIVFLALALSTFLEEGGTIAHPFSASSLILPILVVVASVVVIAWVQFINRLNSYLADHDHASWGPITGGGILAFCLSVTFWYVSSVPDPINLKLLGTPNFIRMFALYLFAIETINIDRYLVRNERTAKLG
ncbi:hypothetical protein FGE05_27960 [Pseudomonas sp. ICMP22404]|uniref:hypothetical protein n=1 Tax=Pseudomonas sp. ICMP22404 TaxID=2583807 RepID=UPI00111904A0|nr:hypothetical protein [Pseudomonas sp. ICMP22404]TNF78760.1 hypothetical protein FGE05_27960 [Pseudomonas sp. ICMP22404]